MDEMKGRHIIRALRRKWVRCTVLSDALVSSGIAFLLALLFNKLFGWSCWWGILYFLAGFALLFFMHRVWRVNETAITQLLDQTYPQLEESSGLLLQPLPSLHLLERLQYQRTNRALLSIPAPLKIAERLMTPAFLFAMVLAAGMVLYKVPFRYKPGLPPSQPAIVNHQQKQAAMLPQIAGINISIAPPAYTAKRVRQQHAFNLEAEEGSWVDWQLQTNIGAGRVIFIFNDTLRFALQSSNADHTAWHFNKKVDSTGFYQVSIDGKISELYKIETIKDHPPVVLLQSPKQYTTIDIGEPQQVNISTAISDDYGITAASVTATIASGSGEAVKFKEQRIALEGFIAGKTQYQLQQLLPLLQLGMQPGDELYFYVQATDNHRQQTRSDVYIVHLPDTAQLMSLEGLANNLNLKPEYFRSERQIIIETEQLLKDKDTISAEAFKNRSNNLGIDQKLLRLRYSKFLGDETEPGENDTPDLDNISNFSNADKIRDAYTDKHDNAEDATFFEPGTKKQLQATLAEMWHAEIPLRTFSPQAALPFEYRALRLLKDLQQQSRAYVAKTNSKTTPLDLKKRLTGDMSKISQPVLQKDIKQEPDRQLPVRNALSVLEELNAGSIQNISLETLQQANLRLQQQAIQQPALYLSAVQALKKIMDALAAGSKIPVDDIGTAEHGLQQLLSAPNRLPSATKSSSGQALSKQYFDNLQKRQL